MNLDKEKMFPKTDEDTENKTSFLNKINKILGLK